MRCWIKRLFQIRFGVFVLEVKEFEDERIFDGFFRGHRIARSALSAFSNIAGLIL